METDWALTLINQMLWNAALLAGPVLLVALFTGVIVSVLQVATQLQELTLSYVPKLAFCGLTLLVLGPWMLHRLTQFAADTIALIPNLN